MKGFTYLVKCSCPIQLANMKIADIKNMIFFDITLLLILKYSNIFFKSN
jgi:hypothetical protein